MIVTKGRLLKNESGYSGEGSSIYRHGIEYEGMAAGGSASNAHE
jgi:hypothetical protein